MCQMTSNQRNGTKNQDKIGTLAENETYKYFDILEADAHQTSGNERQNSKRILQENWKTPRDKTQ